MIVASSVLKPGSIIRTTKEIEIKGGVLAAGEKLVVIEVTLDSIFAKHESGTLNVPPDAIELIA